MKATLMEARSVLLVLFTCVYNFELLILLNTDEKMILCKLSQFEGMLYTELNNDLNNFEGTLNTMKH